MYIDNKNQIVKIFSEYVGTVLYVHQRNRDDCIC